MPHNTAGSSSTTGRDSVGQRLGVKAGDGQLVPAGSIIVRQRGMTFLSGTGTGLGRDYTVFATVTGHVKFESARKDKKRIRVISADEIAAVAARAAAVESASTAKKAGKAERAKSSASAPKRSTASAPKRSSAKPATESAQTAEA
jgi:large subunit ribosomal protein L27